MNMPHGDNDQNRTSASQRARLPARFRLRFSIWVRIVSLIIFVTLLAGGVGSILLLSSSRSYELNDELQNNLEHARLAAAYATNYVQTVQAHVKVFATRPDVRQAILSVNPKQFNQTLAEFVNIQTKLDSCGLYDISGVQIAFYDANSATIGQSFADREWFQQAIANEQAYLGLPVMSRATERPVIPYAVPVLDEEGGICGLLACGISLGQLSDALVNVDHGGDTRTLILDLREGMILAHIDPDFIMTPASAENEAVSRLLSGETGAIETANAIGELEITGFVALTDLPWGIMLVTPSASALAIFDTMIRNVLIASAIIVLFALVSGGALALGITRPFRRLVQDSDAIGRGNLDHKMAPATKDEIGDLSNAIAGMAQNLKKTLVSRDSLAQEVIQRRQAEERVIRLNRILCTMRNVNQLITREDDPQALITGACRNLVETHGFVKCWMAAIDTLGNATTIAEANWGSTFEPLAEQLKKGTLPPCITLVKNRGQAVTVTAEEQSSACGDCLLKTEGDAYASIAASMNYEGKVKGVLAAVLPQDMVHDDEEIGLFQEMADDIAFALHNIEQKEEKRQVERAHIASEMRYRRLFEAAKDGILILDANTGRVDDVNPYLLGLLGYSYEQFTYRYVWDIGPFKDIIANKEKFLELQKTGYVHYENLPLETADGKLIAVEFVSNVYEVDHQRVIQCNIRDISKRIEAEKENQRLARHQATVLAAVPDIIMEVDNNKIYTWANQAGLDFFGKDVIGKKAAYYFEGEQDTYRFVQSIFEGRGETVYIESWQRRKDGEKRLLGWWCRSLKEEDGRVVGALSAAQDITEHQRAEAAIESAAEELRSTFDSITDMICIIDREHKIKRVNRHFADAVKTAPQELIGRHCYRVTHGTDQPSPLCPHIKCMESLKTEVAEYYEPKLDIYIEETASPLFSATGEAIGAVHVMKDITQRKLAVEQEHQLRDKAEMSSRLAAIGEMAAGIAHEINNPLTSVIGFSELLLDEELPPDIQEQIKIIADSSKRVKDIIRRMLTFAKQNKPSKSLLNIHELVDNTLEIRGYVLKTANIAIERYYDPDLPWISVDPGQMQQVFLNLIVNAEYSMKKANRAGTLTITTEKKDGYVRLSFKDTGEGMDQKTKTKIFHPFFTTKAVNEGTGLGLSLSHSIIQEHGGSIEVESQPGQGATFTITLPVTQTTDEEPAEPAAVTPASEQKLQKARILVVDDEETIRLLLRTVFSKIGHAVETTANAADALSKLENTAYDAILLDIRMPGMNGMELYAKATAKRPELVGKFIFITGDTSDTSTKEFLEQNKLPFVSKPFNMEIILAKINELL